MGDDKPPPLARKIAMVNRDENGKVESLTLGIKNVVALCVFLCGLVSAQVANDVAIHAGINDLRRSMGDRWTKSDMELWTERTARANPDWTPSPIIRAWKRD